MADMTLIISALFLSILFLIIVIAVIFYSIWSKNKSSAESAELTASKAELEVANERFRIMLDTTPFICNLWNKEGAVFDCNEAAHKLFDLDKQTYMERFLELAPEIQPDGKSTADIAVEMLNKVFTEGSCSFEYIAQKLDGTPIPQGVVMTRVKYKGDYIAVG